MAKKISKEKGAKLNTLEGARASGLQDTGGDPHDLANAVRELKGKPPLKRASSHSR